MVENSTRTLLLLLLMNVLNGSPLSRALPSGPLIIGYCSWAQCDNSIIETVKNGANVVIWFSIDLTTSESGAPIIGRGLDYDCMAGIITKLREDGLDVVHLISIGGWNSPHIAPGFTAQAWWNVWKEWNEHTVSRPHLRFYGFDGIDWDIEGNDNITSPNNHFSVETLDLMGQISQIAKQDGYLVTMAPAQSYLDPSNSAFDRSLQHVPQWKSDFPYHGYNTYAPLLAKYRTTTIDSKEVDTFDLISIQFYEGWSRANHVINDLKTPVSQYLLSFVEEITEGWMVHFSEDPLMGIPDQTIKVNLNHLVLGLANAWAGPRPSKFLLMYPGELKEFWEIARERGIQPRGFMFWNIKDEGTVLPDGKPLILTSALREFIFNNCQADL